MHILQNSLARTSLKRNWTISCQNFLIQVLYRRTLHTYIHTYIHSGEWGGSRVRDMASVQQGQSSGTQLYFLGMALRSYGPHPQGMWMIYCTIPYYTRRHTALISTALPGKLAWGAHNRVCQSAASTWYIATTATWLFHHQILRQRDCRHHRRVGGRRWVSCSGCGNRCGGVSGLAPTALVCQRLDNSLSCWPYFRLTRGLIVIAHSLTYNVTKLHEQPI